MPKGLGDTSLLSVLDLLPSAAAVWHLDQTLSVLNARAQQLTRCAVLDVGNREQWVKRIHHQDRSRCHSAWQQLQQRFQHTTCDYRFVPKGKRNAVWVREVAVPYHNAQDEVEGILSVFTDISDLRADTGKGRAPSRQRMVRKEQEEQAGITSTAALIDGLSHEVQNSLQGIGLGLDLLRMTQADPLECQTVAQAIARASRFLQEIREFYQPPEPYITTEDPRVILAEVAQQVDTAWPNQDVQWHLVCQESLPSLAFEWRYFGLNWQRVLTFLYALLPQGGEIGIQVKLRKIDAQRYIELRVQISSATPFSIDDTQIWKPFVRVNGYPAGLSMLLVRQMLSRHNGKISFRKKNASQGILTVLLKVQSESVRPATTAVTAITETE
jgi:nitrogen-specific signal transduction histidine kinase